MRQSLTAAMIALVLAACSSSATTTTQAATTTTQAATTTTAAATTTTEAMSTVTVTVATSSLGTILADGDGNTLYLYTPDAQGDSTCYDQCAANWPPLAGEAQAGSGVDGSLLGTTQRTDGTTQVTYNGWPLYHFANDSAPGDTNGQGVGSVWYVVGSDGNAIGS
jgi:predicted lipoprotein with Yx(FWY)xxD motif